MPWAPLYPVEMFERLRLCDGRSETSRTLERSGVAIGDILRIDMACALAEVEIGQWLV
jgi:hypothetical protein